MPFNGSGSFSPPGADYPAVANTLIEAAKFNSIISDMATGLSTTITKDGQTTTTQRIPFAAGISTDTIAEKTADAGVTIDGVTAHDGAINYLTTVAGTNTITATRAGSALTAYIAGQEFTLIPANTNTGAATLNINGVGAKNVFAAGVACTGGEIKASVPICLQYDGTQFNILTPYTPAPVVLTGTWTYGTNSGSLALTGLPFKPRFASVYLQGPANSASIGGSDGTSTFAMVNNNGISAGTWSLDTSNIGYLQRGGGTDFQSVALTSFDAGGLTLSRTNGGAISAGGTVTYRIVVWR